MNNTKQEIDALDRPVWHALTGCQQNRAIGTPAAWRFAPEYGVFAAPADWTPIAHQALSALIAQDEIWLIEKDPFPTPPGTQIAGRMDCLQMIATDIEPGAPTAWDDAVHLLGDADIPAMQALAEATWPGPFRRGTPRLGRFIGIRDGGELVAMSGERMRIGSFTEVSGVCTAPSHRGRGLARLLIAQVARSILSRDEQPFLHSYTDNERANALYAALGFRPHQRVTATILRRDDTP